VELDEERMIARRYYRTRKDVKVRVDSDVLLK